MSIMKPLVNRSLSILLLVAVLVCSSPLFLLGQTATGGGTLTGHVRGPGGVSVPGATVRITELGTGVRKETWTDEQGNYS
ncbi:MAG TPA: carboxypeptidase-like regulatory domain-containing protein, partial [Terriglobia bacterium]|nr:carboxypeptidase-like regulatory domain-containing protein [Terriglobia bacterium]